MSGPRLTPYRRRCAARRRPLDPGGIACGPPWRGDGRSAAGAAPLARVREEAAGRELAADERGRRRVLAELEGAERGAEDALVVEHHPHVAVLVDPREELADEAGGVAVPDRPLAEGERLLVELAVEGVKPGEVGEPAVEVGADPVDVLVARVVGRRAVLRDVGRAGDLRRPDERDRRARERLRRGDAVHRRLPERAEGRI